VLQLISRLLHDGVHVVVQGWTYAFLYSQRTHMPWTSHRWVLAHCCSELWIYACLTNAICPDLVICFAD
jgi:hypothetical protein